MIEGSSKFTDRRVETKDEILKARFTPFVADNIRKACIRHNITVTDFIRDAVKILGYFMDDAEKLWRHRETVKTIVRNLD